ncbi:MAG: major coat protein [Gallionella sp.]|jgi:hypothetical protein
MNRSKILAAVSAVALTASASAFAALPASVGTTVTAIQADGQAIFDLIFPVVAAFVGLGVVVTLFKRFTKKV